MGRPDEGVPLWRSFPGAAGFVSSRSRLSVENSFLYGRASEETIMRMTNRESDVLAGCLQYLALKGVFAWRQNQGAIPLKGGGYRRFVGLRGVADILGVLPQSVDLPGEGRVRFGNLLAVEVKRPGEAPRPDQSAFLARVNELGGVGVCVHSVRELEERLAVYL